MTIWTTLRRWWSLEARVSRLERWIDQDRRDRMALVEFEQDINRELSSGTLPYEGEVERGSILEMEEAASQGETVEEREWRLEQNELQRMKHDLRR